MMKLHHTSPFGLLVTPKMRWVVLRNTGIDCLNLTSMLYVSKTSNAMEVTSAPNPWNDSEIFHYVEETDRPKTILTIRRRCIPVSFHNHVDTEQKFMDILEEECEKSSLLERRKLCERMAAIHCPYFDRNKKPLLRYLTK